MPSFVVLAALAALLAVTLPQEASAWVSSSDRVNCESKKGQYKLCRAPWAGQGVRLVEQRSKAACTRGYSWGHTRDAVWVDKGCHGLFEAREPQESEGRRLTCSSRGGLVRCPAETRKGVTLARQHSDAPCRWGRTWGYTRHGIWVDGGCRAEFRMGGGYNPVAPPSGADDERRPERVTCQSWGEDIRECALGGSARQVALIRDLGQTRCKLGKNWGWNRRAIWVGERCGGLFEVEYR